jgi:hypothetical protein
MVCFARGFRNPAEIQPCHLASAANVASAQIHVKHLPNKRTAAYLDRRTTNDIPTCRVASGM